MLNPKQKMDFSAYTRFHALAQDRRSCRNYIVLDAEADPEVRDIILKVYNRPWIATAPVYIVAVGMHNQAWHRPCDGKDHADIDVAIAVEHICLAASALGLGSCWVCNFEASELHRLLQLGSDEEPVAIIPVGYPADADAPRRGRKSLDEIVQWGRKA